MTDIPTAESQEDREGILRYHATLTQMLLPREGDSIKIEQNGQTWYALHIPSRETVRARRAERWQTIRHGAAFVVTLLGVSLVIAGFQLAWVPGVRRIGGGIVLLAFAAWLVWVSQTPVPREDNNART